MVPFRVGAVTAAEAAVDGIQKVTVTFDDASASMTATLFPSHCGTAQAGDRVVVNTIGIDLGLGTGGEGFVLWNLDRPLDRPLGPGHIVKMRYTPWQTAVLAAEETDSPHHEALRDVTAVPGVPVVVCSLHSQVAAVAAGIKAAAPDARVGYLMTDGAALPLLWSKLVHRLREADLIDVTATAGHAFGGDLECINVFSGIAALRIAGSVDVVIAAMGPGVVGSGSALGFTGMEQGQVLDAAGALRARPIACVRMGWADSRARHHGVSHHALTALTIGTQRRCTVVLPTLDDDKAQIVAEQLASAGVDARHDLVVADGAPGVALMRRHGVTPASMGRSFDEVPELHLAGAAAGWVAGGG